MSLNLRKRRNSKRHFTKINDKTSWVHEGFFVERAACLVSWVVSLGTDSQCVLVCRAWVSAERIFFRRVKNFSFQQWSSWSRNFYWYLLVFEKNIVCCGWSNTLHCYKKFPDEKFRHLRTFVSVCRRAYDNKFYTVNVCH